MTGRPIALIIGGSSGLGYELAKRLTQTHEVHITGRTEPSDHTMHFHQLDLSLPARELQDRIRQFVTALPDISLFIYGAGFAQIGNIDLLSSSDIENMVNISLIAPAAFVKEILQRQGSLATAVVITSTSQRTPREKEPLYAAAKAGLGMLASSLSLDHRIGKTLVLAPGGMRTGFWKGTGQATESFLDPIHVADVAIEQLDENYKYRHVEIPRQTGKPAIIEER